MATEHVVDIKARLDESDVRRKVEQLNARHPAGGQGAGAAQGLDGLSQSLKRLRGAFGGAAVAQSFGEISKSLRLFGDRTEEVTRQFTGSFNRMLGAISTGNPAIVALTGAMEGLNFAFQATVGAAQRERDRAVASLNEQNARVMKWQDFRAGVAEYRRGRAMEGAIASGDTSSMKAWLEVMKTMRADVEESIRAGLAKGWTKDRNPELGGLVSQAEKYDAAVRLLEDALKRQVEATAKAAEAARNSIEGVLDAAAKKSERRRRELGEAKDRWRFGEDFRGAEGIGDSMWLEDAMNRAMEGMRQATSAQEFNRQSSIFAQTRDALTRLEQNARGGQAAQLQRLLGANAGLNSFQQAGFGMGETSPTQNLEQQVEQIIRLMQESMQRQMQYTNVNATL